MAEANWLPEGPKNSLVAKFLGLTDLENSWIRCDMCLQAMLIVSLAAGWKQGSDYDDPMTWRPQVDLQPVST